MHYIETIYLSKQEAKQMDDELRQVTRADLAPAEDKGDRIFQGGAGGGGRQGKLTTVVMFACNIFKPADINSINYPPIS
jgi:hypothetical protein